MTEKKAASEELQDFLADLQDSFGKKVKTSVREPAHKTLNKQFHDNNPQIQKSRGKDQHLKIENYYDWEMHRRHLKSIDSAQMSMPELSWLPEAQISFIIHQTCSCCKETVTFVGNEYIRFRGARRRWKDLYSNESRWTYPTMLKRVSEVDGNLMAYGLPDGNPLPDLTEEMNETVRRCAGCINLERQALDIWVKAVNPNPQGELLIEFENDDGSVTRL